MLNWSQPKITELVAAEEGASYSCKLQIGTSGGRDLERFGISGSTESVAAEEGASYSCKLQIGTSGRRDPLGSATTRPIRN